MDGLPVAVDGLPVAGGFTRVRAETAVASARDAERARAAIAVAVTAARGREAARAKLAVARVEVVAHGSKRTLVRASAPPRRKSEMARAG